MEFPLLKLPFLAIQEVLSKLQFHEIIEFSFCSTRSKFLIQSMRRQLYKAIDMISGETYQHKRMELVVPGELRKIGSTDIRFQKNGDVIASEIFPTNPIKVVYEYLQELFKNLSIGEFTCGATRDHGLFFPGSFGITKCRELYFFRCSIPILDEQLRYILEKVQVQKYLGLLISFNPNFRIDASVKMSTDHIYGFASWMTRDTFFSLDCIRLHLRNVNLTTTDFEDFAQKWLRSTSTRLIWMECSSKIRFDPFDFSQFQTIPWDPKVRGKWFGLGHRTILMHGTRVDCSDGMDIIRASDGLMATIKCAPNTFQFVVWHERFHDFGNISENQLVI